MDYDDIERQMLILELEDEYLEVLKEKHEEYQTPDWWNIGLGIREAASPAHEFQSKELYKSFLRFKTTGLTFQQRVEAFTQMRLNGASK